MTRNQFLAELKIKHPEVYQKLDKLVFKNKSSYMANRYKDEFVTWEAWLYRKGMQTGFLVTAEDWTSDNINSYLKSFTY